MNIGKIVQENLWKQSSAFVVISEKSSSPTDFHTISLMLLRIVIKGVVDVTCNSIHKVMDTCMQKLLIFELNGCFTLTINRLVHGKKEHICLNMIGIHEELWEKLTVTKKLS